MSSQRPTKWSQEKAVYDASALKEHVGPESSSVGANMKESWPSAWDLSQVQDNQHTSQKHGTMVKHQRNKFQETWAQVIEGVFHVQL